MKFLNVAVLVSLCLVSALLFSCFGPAPQTGPALGEQFTIATGEIVSIRGEPLKIRFDAVTEDSRCPLNVVCIQAGRAVCQLTLTTGVTTEIALNETGGTNGFTRQTAGGYAWEFQVTPYPKAGEPIKPADYRLTLTVTRAS